MSEGAPELIAINHDDYSAKHIGRTADGRQFFLTTPFVPGGREFIALYLFDDEGSLLEAKIDDLGLRKEVDNDAARVLIETRLAELGDISFGDIEVAPFRLERFNTEFGFILSWVNTPQLAAYREAHSASGAQRDFHLQQACP